MIEVPSFVNFTAVAIGCLIFMLCLSGVLIMGAPMFKEMKAEAMAKQVGTSFADSQAGLENLGRVEGYTDNSSESVTDFVIDKMENMEKKTTKGGIIGAAIRLGGMMIGIFTKMMFFTDIFPKGLMPEPFGTLFKVTFLIPFWVATLWILSSKLVSFLPFFGGGEGG